MAVHTRLTKPPAKGARNIEHVDTHTSTGIVYFKIEYVGKVVETGSTYIGDGDSSYWAIVAAGSAFKKIWTGSTYDTYYGGHAEVDAPADLIARWQLVKAARRAKAMAASAKIAATRERERVAYEMTQPHIGAKVKVVKGRKVPVGMVGTVTWVGESNWGRRARVAPEGGAEPVFIATSNLKVLSQAPGFRP